MAGLTQSALAKRLGVSRSTVAAVLNARSTVHLSAATREKVLQAAKEMDYRPHRYAQVLRSGPTGLIGIIHSGGLLQSASERAYHCAQALQAAGFQLLGCDVSWFSQGLESAVQTLLEARVEGVVFAGLNVAGASAQIAPLKKAGVSMVNLSGDELPGLPQVRGDARGAVAGLTRHLLGNGRRRLVLLIPAESGAGRGGYAWARRERMEGFTQAVEHAGGVVTSGKGRLCRGREITGEIVQHEHEARPFDPFQPGHAAMESVLRREGRPDAVVCSNDDWAIGAIRACTDAGWRVPEDVAVTGFDNTAVGSYLPVPLTTAAQPSAAIAAAGVELLLKLRGGASPGRGERLLRLECPLIFRASSGAPKATL